MTVRFKTLIVNITEISILISVGLKSFKINYFRIFSFRHFFYTLVGSPLALGEQRQRTWTHEECRRLQPHRPRWLRRPFRWSSQRMALRAPPAQRPLPLAHVAHILRLPRSRAEGSRLRAPELGESQRRSCCRPFQRRRFGARSDQRKTNSK